MLNDLPKVKEKVDVGLKSLTLRRVLFLVCKFNLTLDTRKNLST